MKNFKCKIFINLMLILSMSTFAQKSDAGGHVKLLKKYPARIFLGGGISIPNPTAKDAVSFENLTNINISAYIPVKSFDKRSWGIEGGFNYGWNNSDICPAIEPFQILGQNSPPVLTEKGSGVPRQANFRIGIGPGAEFSLGDKFSILPSIQAAYISFSESKCSITQNSSINGISYDWNLCDRITEKSSGIGFLPKLKFIYQFGRIGLWIEGNYLLGQKMKTTTTTLVPEGNAQNGFYNVGQMNFATYQTTVKNATYSAFGINGGIVIGLGKGITEKGIKKNEKTKNTAIHQEITSEDEKFPPNIQKLIDEQDRKANNTFQYVNESSKKSAQSKCNFEVVKVDIQCNGKDQNGNKKYSVSIQYKNLSTSGSSKLGHYAIACTPNTSNGNYLNVLPANSATISNLSPANSASTIIAPGATQTIIFDFVPQPGFSSLNIQGNTINAITGCGNCDDNISLNLPNCCDGCEKNPVVVKPVSIVSVNPNTGVLQVTNSVSTPNNIVRIDSDLVAVKYFPTNSDCVKCNNLLQNQNNFIDANKIQGTGWKNSGNGKYVGENTNPNISRSLTFASANSNGIPLANPANIVHKIGVSPVSCCDDTVEIWIRYTVWDKDCNVCDKLVKSVISRKGSCSGTSTGGTSGPFNPHSSEAEIQIKNLKN
ncbi:hypothetical protein EG359_20490 [Chryseobacterium joostei]|uniref:Outer membrane protein beta-barrel domain-containing protein n=1 Tax=Chryseobacterium joostei TaxID=112234 RepID=A0A1N7KP18_9FLAO|nr:hypothetical protein [Chryseobacterium joostei]AZB01822.1 hypothetical protein EG359_20490 [Chryseobacterium joostei]SIS63362.1 hypothetical protein SAMN05421768_1178 [Chryseobacterium joostei]